MTTKTVNSQGPGNYVTLEIHSQHLTEVFTGFGQKGVPAEKVATGVVEQAQRYLTAGVPVGEHLADQLLLPMALAGGGSFRTLAPSSHANTNMEVLRRFLDVAIDTKQLCTTSGRSRSKAAEAPNRATPARPATRRWTAVRPGRRGNGRSG